MMKKSMFQPKKRWLFTMPLNLCCLLLLLFVVYVGYSLGHTSRAVGTLEEYQAACGEITIVLNEDDSVALLPEESGDVGILFYPGASVEPLAYVPFLSLLAEEGYCVYVPSFPFGMAAFDPDAAEEIMAAHPEIEAWVLAGHSLGGRTVCGFAAEDGESVLGVVVISSRIDEALLDSELPVLVLYGDRDGIYGGVRADDLLPENTTVVCIPGGNHAQFGDYGRQLMDREATLPAEEQRRVGAAEILAWLESAA